MGPNLSVILVEPQHPGNVGSVARVMKNFGIDNLILVNPCNLDENAHNMAVHAKDILLNAKIVRYFEKEIKNYDLVIGTSSKETSKDDYFLRICLTPEQMREKLSKVSGKIAIVFGREDTGLTNEQLKHCDFIVKVPTSKKYRTMNLSHSAAVIFYELFKSRKSGRLRLASGKEKEIFMEQVSKIMDKINYPPEKREIFLIMIKKIIGRAIITGREVNTLIGILKKICKKLQKEQ